LRCNIKLAYTKSSIKTLAVKKLNSLTTSIFKEHTKINKNLAKCN